MSRMPSVAAMAGIALSVTALADVVSGPAVGAAVPKLSVAAVTGEHANESLDYAARREAKPTVYVFVPAEKWGRPTARLVKKLDTDIATVSTEARVVGVWLTADAAATREYLPKAHQALQLANSALTTFDGPAAGPQEWNLDSDADVTVVVAEGAKVVATFGFESPNETVADGVIEALKKGVK